MATYPMTRTAALRGASVWRVIDDISYWPQGILESGCLGELSGCRLIAREDAESWLQPASLTRLYPRAIGTCKPRTRKHRVNRLALSKKVRRKHRRS